MHQKKEYKIHHLKTINKNHTRKSKDEKEEEEEIQ